MTVPNFQVCHDRCVGVLRMHPRDAEAVVTHFGRHWCDADFRALEEDDWESVDAMMRTTRILLIAEHGPANGRKRGNAGSNNMSANES